MIINQKLGVLDLNNVGGIIAVNECVTYKKPEKNSKMEYQPVEILDLMFRQLENANDIRKCYMTCFKWKKVIEGIFKDSSIVFFLHIFISRVFWSGFFKIFWSIVSSFIILIFLYRITTDSRCQMKEFFPYPLVRAWKNIEIYQWPKKYLIHHPA